MTTGEGGLEARCDGWLQVFWGVAEAPSDASGSSATRACDPLDFVFFGWSKGEISAVGVFSDLMDSKAPRRRRGGQSPEVLDLRALRRGLEPAWSRRRSRPAQLFSEKKILLHDLTLLMASNLVAESLQ